MTDINKVIELFDTYKRIRDAFANYSDTLEDILDTIEIRKDLARDMDIIAMLGDLLEGDDPLNEMYERIQFLDRQLIRGIESVMEI